VSAGALGAPMRSADHQGSGVGRAAREADLGDALHCIEVVEIVAEICGFID